MEQQLLVLLEMLLRILIFQEKKHYILYGRMNCFQFLKKNTLPIKDKMSKRMLSEILSQNLSETYIAEYISSTVKNRSYSKKSLYI